ncbi:hypothetical protein MKX03_003468 [Papaver bracteatum]|nr:hypothetical protein MKX03_003468 [Papaver bracteatum]
MEEAANNSNNPAHQQQLMKMHKQQLLYQHYQQQLQQQNQFPNQNQAISRFPSNIDAHLRPLGSLQQQQQQQQRSINLQQQQQQQQQQQIQQQGSNPNPNPNLNVNVNLQQQQQKVVSRQGQQAELEMAYQDAWRVCHPDIKRPFSSLEDACERLLPYHVVADYEAEEDDRILDSDTTGQMPSRSQQWDHNIASKVSEFTSTFEKQVLAFNIISRKRSLGEFRSEERLMLEQALLQDEKHALLELRAEIESREKASRDAAEAKMRMAAMVQAEQARVEAQTHAEMLARAPMRGSAVDSQADEGSVGHEMSGHEQVGHMDEMIHGWGSTHREDDEPSEDFLNDENEPENGDTGIQDEWREVGEFDLNTR